jgi:hypothetical protein
MSEEATQDRATLVQGIGERITRADERATACERDADTYREQGAAWRAYAEALRQCYTRLTITDGTL